MSLSASLTAVGLRPLCSESALIPLIESPSLPQFPFDSVQARQPLSHFLTLLNPSLGSREADWHFARSLYALHFRASGEDSATRRPLQRKSLGKDINSHLAQSRSSKEPLPLMARRTERDEPDPRYHPCSFGRTSEGWESFLF